LRVFLRNTFIMGTGYTDNALTRPVPGIAGTGGTGGR
jgi:hypothetical protein